MNRKIISLDLDGTTLNSHSQISELTATVLHKAAESGNIVSIVTGRPNRMAVNFYDELRLKTPMINFNGAVGHLPHRYWKDAYEITFQKEIVLEILKSKKTLGIQAVAAEGQHLTLTDSTDNSVSPFFPAAMNARNLLNHLNLTTDPSAITMLVDPTRKAAITRQIQEAYKEEVNVSVWGGPAPILELSPKNVTKKVGMKFLSKIYHVKREDIIAFGDEQNDMEMLKYAGTGLAMKNASPWIKEVADDVTSRDNDHDGIAHYLIEHLDWAE